MTRSFDIPRLRLLDDIGNFPERHVLISAPFGYGKTLLLHQLHRRDQSQTKLVRARPTDTFDSLTFLLPSPVTLLIDDGHLLSRQTIRQLLEAPPQALRVIIATYHIEYPKAQLLYQRGQLMIIPAELMAFDENETAELLVDKPAEAIRRIQEETLGWPHLVTSRTNHLTRTSGYLDDLLDGVGEETRELLKEIAQDSSLTFRSLGEHEKQLLETAHRAGFPLLPHHEHLQLHPLIARHLLRQAGEDSAPVRTDDLLLQDLLEQTDILPGELARHLGRYFRSFGENDQDSSLKRELLERLLPDHLSPALTNTYAKLLLGAGNRDQARTLLAQLHSVGQDSTRTHLLLLELAIDEYDTVAQPMHLEHARKRITSATEESQYLAARSVYQVRHTRARDGVASAQQAYEIALISQDQGATFTALMELSYALQMDNNLEGAMHNAEKALPLLKLIGPTAIRQAAKLYYRMADMLKDLGRYEDALAYIQKGVNLHGQVTSSVQGSLYVVRGLVYMELGDMDRALAALENACDAFEVAGNPPSTALAHSYISYALYRVGRSDEISVHLNMLQRIQQQVNDSDGEYAQNGAFIPLALGLMHLGAERPEQAIEAFSSLKSEGMLTYDSVLLTHLLKCQLRVKNGSFSDVHAEFLLKILNARSNPGDVTVRLYGRDFQDVFRHVIAMNVAPARFTALLQTSEAPAATATTLRNRLELRTLGQTALLINGHPASYREKAKYTLTGVRLLTYLVMADGEWRDTERIGRDLFGDPSDPATRARQAMSYVRGMLRASDAELETLLLSSGNQPGGYRMLSNPEIDVELDVSVYLSPRFSRTNDDLNDLQTLLNALKEFLPGEHQSPFVQNVNAQLRKAAVNVALHIDARCRQENRRTEGVTALLKGLHFSEDPRLMTALEELHPELQPDTRRRVENIARWVKGADTEHVPLSELIDAALRSSEQDALKKPVEQH